MSGPAHVEAGRQSPARDGSGDHRPLGRWTGNLVALGLALVLSVALAEGVLRMFPGLLPEEAALRLHWRGIASAEREVRGTMIIADDEIGYLYRPFSHGRISRNEIDFTYDTDEHGFRNTSPWPDHAGIVVVGDSLPFGYGVAREEAWPSLVAGALPDNQVINLGLPGLAPRQATKIFKRFGGTARARIAHLQPLSR